MFIGRSRELAFLEERYSSNKSEFVVLYGRRRIGKTELLKAFCKDKSAIFYTALQITDAMQLEKFSAVVNDFFGESKYNRQFSDWDTLFSFIGDQLKPPQKIVLVIDEFPYAAENNTSLASIIQKHWDHALKDLPFMLIISGSSMSFIENEVLGSKNPLYGRATAIYKLQELTFEDARTFVPDLPIKQQIEYYSIFSGVPHYLNQINPSLSVRDNIKKSILQTGSILFNEIEFLLKQELREVSVYNSIIEAIAMGNTKLNDIAMCTGIATTKIPYYLTSLINLGIIDRVYPATVKTKARAKSRSGLYQIANDFFRFYYRYIYPYTSEISEGASEIILDAVIMATLSEFTAQTFEKVAYQYVWALNIQGQLGRRYTKIGRYWHKATEIDLLGFNHDNQYLFAECKWTNQPIGADVLKRLEDKAQQFNCSAKDFIILSKSGFKKSLKSLQKSRDDIMLIDFSGQNIKKC